ncbi:MAG: hypothetical protein KDK41_07330 [Leptospiraceae bacterium]|nr:hypothetical protein [Leptospiraceae bacterium]
MKKIPFILALLTMIGGVTIAIAFGVNEDSFKRVIRSGLLQNQPTMRNPDPETREKQIESEAEKIWRYYQRYHFHSTGIGAMALSALLFLQFMVSSGRLRDVSSWFISVGGFLYPMVWLFAAIYAPELGREAAKERFMFFGFMGGVFLVGLILAVYAYIKTPIEIQDRKAAD